MIVTRLQGGLGNQMFQYAFGYQLCLAFKQDLYVDLCWFKEQHNKLIDTPRNFALDCFHLQAKQWQAEMNAHFFPSNNLYSKISHQLRRKFGSDALLYERKLGFDASILPAAKQNTYAVGYWQSALYFQQERLALSRQFIFNNPPATSLKLQVAAAPQPTAIHVRRGDYAANAGVQAQHGLLPLSYYKNAVQKLHEHEPGEKQWFVFSDDMAWCRENFNWLHNVEFCETGAYPHWYDMYLMTQCHHHIIANSSYSWWGAWLAAHSHKQVIAPMQWFTHTNSVELQMHPPEWILV